MNRRGYPYKVINPDVPCRVTVHLDPEAASVLAQLQKQEQERIGRKVAVTHLVADIVKGRVKLPA